MAERIYYTRFAVVETYSPAGYQEPQALTTNGRQIARWLRARAFAPGAWSHFESEPDFVMTVEFEEFRITRVYAKRPAQGGETTEARDMELPGWLPRFVHEQIGALFSAIDTYDVEREKVMFGPYSEPVSA